MIEIIKVDWLKNKKHFIVELFDGLERKFKTVRNMEELDIYIESIDPVRREQKGGTSWG